jgi:hypothetical protein
MYMNNMNIFDMKALYALQPYHVGSKDRKSLALIIPAKVAKRYNVDTSTVFTLTVDDNRKRIMLQTMNEITSGAKIC